MNGDGIISNVGKRHKIGAHRDSINGNRLADAYERIKERVRRAALLHNLGKELLTSNAIMRKLGKRKNNLRNWQHGSQRPNGESSQEKSKLREKREIDGIHARARRGMIKELEENGELLSA